MNASLGLALALAAAIVSVPALADAPPDARHAVPAPGAIAGHHPRTVSIAPRRMRRAHRFDSVAVVAAGPVYGREPRYFPGAGGASPNAGFGAPIPVAVVGYREPYIGRGLIYNTPPEPNWTLVGWSGRSNVISVKY